MQKISMTICNNKKKILIISIILAIISVFGMIYTKVNYDVLVYLPKDIETIKGQEILTNDFEIGSYSLAVTENCSPKEILSLEKRIKKIDGVNHVVTSYDAVGVTIPTEMIPNEISNRLKNDNTDLMVITFKESTSNEKTLDAVNEIRKVTNGKVKQGAMSSMVVDTMDLSNKEITIYIVIAVILCIIILELFLDSYVLPFLLLINIGFAILLNLGSNIMFGEISYITKALVAVLQLGVTTDFSIFLYHSFENNKKQCVNKKEAMSKAINETFKSVMGSSLTTIAGFLVLCAMSLTLGKDLGLVMAKGVFFGLVSVLTLLPSLILTFDKLIDKTKHKNFIPNFHKLNEFIVKYNKAFFVLLLILIIPFYLAYSKVEVYYKLDKSLPETLESISTNLKVKEEFNLVSPEMILLNKDIKYTKVNKMLDELENVEGIDFTLSSSKLEQAGISKEILPSDFRKIVESKDYQLIIINSLYEIASDDLNSQIIEVNNIVKSYDKNAIVAGEGPLMKDLVKLCDKDFKNVNLLSIGCVLLILIILLKNITLPVLLVTTIEFAIFLNMGISYFNGDILPFVAPIVLGTIQLGATIDYAILMTTTYIENRKQNVDKKQAMIDTLDYCGISIFVSAMCFFAATFGVGVYSQIEMIGSLCTLISRGAIISMIVVIFVLPSVLLTFDKIFIKNKKKGNKNMKTKTSLLTLLFISLFMVFPANMNALSKNETIYTKLNYDGSVKKVIVNEEIKNTSNEKIVKDTSYLKNIVDLNNDEEVSFLKNQNTWNANGKDILYQGTTNQKLPIDIKIDYYLNNKKYDIDDIIGKSGDIKIKINYINNDAHIKSIGSKCETFYTPFVVVLGTIIDGENNKNVNVNNGKVINNGNSYIVASIASPGLDKSVGYNSLEQLNSITISYTTTKFELSSIYNIITPKVIDLEDLNIFDKVDEIVSQANTLQENMDKIEKGSKELKSGSEKLKNGVKSAIESINNMPKEALNEEQINTIKEMTVNQVKTSFTEEYKSQIGNKALENLKNNETYESFKSGITSLEQAGITSDLVSICTSEEIPSAYEQICLNNKTYIEKYNMLTQMISLMEQTTYNVSVSTAYETAIQTAGSVSLTLAPSVANTVKENAINTFSESLNTLYSGIDLLDTGVNTLNNGISQYNKEGIQKVSNLINQTINPTMKRVKVLNELGNNYNSFNENTNIKKETKIIAVVDSKSFKEEIKQNTKKTKKSNLWIRIKNLFS